MIKVKEYRGHIRNWEELCERLDIPLDLTREEREEQIDRVGKSDAEEFIICTENGVRYELEKRYPNKKFYFTKTEPVCEDMKMITLEKIAHVLRTGENEVQMDEALRAESKKPLEKMLDLAK